MLTQQELAAGTAQAQREPTILSGALGQVFIWACLIMVGMSYCTHKTPAPDAKTTKLTQSAKAPKSKVSAPVKKPASKPSQILISQPN